MFREGVGVGVGGGVAERERHCSPAVSGLEKDNGLFSGWGWGWGWGGGVAERERLQSSS